MNQSARKYRCGKVAGEKWDTEAPQKKLTPKTHQKELFCVGKGEIDSLQTTLLSLISMINGISGSLVAYTHMHIHAHAHAHTRAHA